nr:hypothetical protein Itr_chr14CG30910 [Ipomoea trifida]
MSRRETSNLSPSAIARRTRRRRFKRLNHSAVKKLLRRHRIRFTLFPDIKREIENILAFLRFSRLFLPGKRNTEFGGGFPILIINQEIIEIAVELREMRGARRSAEIAAKRHHHLHFLL